MAQEDYDDYDDYEDGNNDELSPEDKEQMRQGTIKVRASLGPSDTVTDKAIQDALWNYYYDVAKSVAYLKSKQSQTDSSLKQRLTSADKQNPPPTNKKQANEIKSKLNLRWSSLSVCPGRVGHDAFASSRSRSDADEHQNLVADPDDSASVRATEFFKDCPWLSIPEQRKAEIIIEPVLPRPKLLGGASNSGKPSKLAALAAKRRQKDTQSHSQNPSPDAAPKDDYLSSLKRLRVTQIPEPQPESAAKNPSEGDSRKGKETSKSTQADSAECRDKDDDSESSLEVRQELRGQPSAFANIMTSHDTGNHVSLAPELVSSKALPLSVNFAESSPDDIVTKAQSAKGRT